MKNCQTWYGKDGLLGKCTFEDVFFPFPKVGHVSSLEGSPSRSRISKKMV